MLCLSWCVVSLVLHSLLLINDCVCRENYLGPLKDDIVKRNVLQTSGRFDYKVIRLKRRAPPPFPPPNTPVGQLKHSPLRSDEVRRPPHHLPPSIFECRGSEPWMIRDQWQVRHYNGSPGQKDRDTIPPGQIKGPCGFKLPPGQRKRIWPPPIIEDNKDFKYPSIPWDDTSQNQKENDIVYINNRPIILLRHEDIRK